MHLLQQLWLQNSLFNVKYIYFWYKLLVGLRNDIVILNSSLYDGGTDRFTSQYGCLKLKFHFPFFPLIYVFFGLVGLISVTLRETCRKVLI